MKRYLRNRVVFLTGHINHVVMKRIFALIQPCDKFPNAALITHGILPFFSRPLIHRINPKPRIQKGLFSHSGMKRFIVINRIFKHLRIRFKGDGGACTIRLPYHSHLLSNLAPGKTHFVNLAVFMNLNRQPFRKRVDHRCTHTMKASGNLISSSSEFSSGMKDGIHHFQGRLSSLRLNIYRNTPTVVYHGDGISLVDLNQDFRTVSRQSLINGIIYNFINQMVKTR